MPQIRQAETRTRDLLGYAGAPPDPHWPGGARVAVSIVVNFEEGAELSISDGDPENEAVYEIEQRLAGRPDPAIDSHFEYGSRAGWWRIMEVLGQHGAPATVSSSGRAVERLPLLAQDAVRRGHEVSAHGWRWEGHADLDEAEERDRIARTVAAIKAVTGTRPLGWHTRSPGSVNTRRLLVEEGGFLYDSDAYNDDLPYFVQIGDKRHLVLPYAFDTNDMQFFHTNRFSGAADFAAYAIDAFDWLHREGAHAPKMMSMGCTCEWSAGPAASVPSTGFFGILPTEGTPGSPGGSTLPITGLRSFSRSPDMSASLIRSRAMVTHAIDRHRWNEIADGAVLQEDGAIVEIGSYPDLSRKYPNVAVVGSGNEVMLPGFVNGHHHIGLTPVQLGSPDMPLELWFVTRMVMRNVNLYLDTLYSAFEMIASGVTTVQHLHGRIPGKLDQVDRGCDEAIRAYQDVGMRVSYSYAVRDQNRLVYQRDEDFIASLPSELRAPTQRWFERFQLTLDDDIELFEGLYDRYRNARRVKVQLAPANLHWCSDAALARLADCSRKYGVPLHMHLLETAYQKEYARRRGGCTAVEYIDRFGLLGPQMTLGHGVWLNERDIDRLAETGTCVCHNCSSNFRLRSGVAALNKLEAAGITTAIGIDEAGINDDRDMLQEMRMVLRAHRVPGMDDEVPTPAQVFRMATSGGAATTPFADTIGTLEVGRAADMVLIDWREVSSPYLDPETPLLDAVLQRAKTSSVRTVICDGDVIYQDGKFTKVDRDGALRALHEDLHRALSDDEVERRRLSKSLLPHVRAFYANYFDPDQHAPFYRQSARQ